MVCNTTCQSADRFWAVLYPNTYRINAKRYITICFLITAFYSGVASIARFFGVRHIDGKCDVNEDSLTNQVASFVDSGFRYVIPMTVIVSINILVFRELHRMGLFKFETRRKRTPSSDTVVSMMNQEDQAAQSVIKSQRKIFLNVTLLTVEMTAIEVVTIILSVLDAYDMLDFGVDSTCRMCFIFVTALLSGCNPFVEISTMTILRNSFRTQWLKYLSKFRQIHLIRNVLDHTKPTVER
ncbi:unnamed protein product [Echinostoma caproni]|uniref:G_PROTEIN_RECEP_F1_2 domain-containing protein n=1 Tax=Echinostoma caproni TaxID=27848 RepID=A0A183A5Y7_9TREM|nr:unnamed protein product [Echinostoma caproni]